jgi:hypothetical protein
MPVADLRTCCAMLGRACPGRLAFSAVNVPSLTTVSAVLRGFAGNVEHAVIDLRGNGQTMFKA